MAVRVIVPDASVLLKWVLPGDGVPDTDAALSLRAASVCGAISLIAPQLWMYEGGNTLARKFPEHADQLLGTLVDSQIAEAQLVAPWRERTLSLKRAYGVTFYDTSYHAVALIHGGLFVTADERYVRRAADAGGLVLLRHWESRPVTHRST